MYDVRDLIPVQNPLDRPDQWTKMVANGRYMLGTLRRAMAEDRLDAFRAALDQWESHVQSPDSHLYRSTRVWGGKGLVQQYELGQAFLRVAEFLKTHAISNDMLSELSLDPAAWLPLLGDELADFSVPGYSERELGSLLSDITARVCGKQREVAREAKVKGVLESDGYGYVVTLTLQSLQGPGRKAFYRDPAAPFFLMDDAFMTAGQEVCEWAEARGLWDAYHDIRWNLTRDDGQPIDTLTGKSLAGAAGLGVARVTTSRDKMYDRLKSIDTMGVAVSAMLQLPDNLRQVDKEHAKFGGIARAWDIHTLVLGAETEGNEPNSEKGDLPTLSGQRLHFPLGGANPLRPHGARADAIESLKSSRDNKLTIIVVSTFDDLFRQLAFNPVAHHSYPRTFGGPGTQISEQPQALVERRSDLRMEPPRESGTLTQTESIAELERAIERLAPELPREGFVGREEELHQASRIVQQDSFVLNWWGDPGIGKSETVRKLIADMDLMHRTKWVPIPPTPPGSVDDAVRRLVEEIAVPLRFYDVLIERQPERQLDLLRHRLCTALSDHILVIDDAEHPQYHAAIRQLMNHGVSPRLIVISRESCQGFSAHLRIVGLSHAAASHLFRQLAQLEDDWCSQQIGQLVELLGRHPLAIRLIAPIIAQKHERLKQSTVARLGQDLQTVDPAAWSTNTAKNLRTVFGVAYSALDSELLKQIVIAMGAFAVSGAPAKALAFVTGAEPGRCEMALDELTKKLSLLTPTKTDSYRLHVLLHEFVRDRLRGEIEHPSESRLFAATPIGAMLDYYCEYAQEHRYQRAELDADRDNLLQAIDWAIRFSDIGDPAP